MKKWFPQPYHGKFESEEPISDSRMLRRGLVTVVTILLCLAAISFSAYAYFSSTVASSSNVIRSATFGLSLSVTDTSTSEPVSLMGSGNKSFRANLTAGTYQVTVRASNDSTASGFCKVRVDGSEEVYHTKQLDSGSFSFNVTLTGNAAVLFDANWGTSSFAETNQGHWIEVNGETITLSGSAGTTSTSSDSQAVNTTPIQTNDAVPHAPMGESVKPVDSADGQGAATPKPDDSQPAAPVTQPTEAPTEAPAEPVEAETEAPAEPVEAETEAPAEATEAPTEAPDSGSPAAPGESTNEAPAE